MKKRYKAEIEAMRDFYEELDITPDYSCNTDGCVGGTFVDANGKIQRIGGTLVEIKLNRSGGLPLKQLKRYIKSYNAVALSLPRYSLFVNVNQREFTFIDNSNWKIITDGKWKHPQDLSKYLDKKDYIKGWIDEFSIVSYNDKFYSQHLSAKKEDFIEEIKNPKELVIKPYQWNETGDMERSILDCLGGKELKKRLGAFFTPNEYVKISTEYLRNAIARVPKGYDYIILDRCAGTGNLQKFLTNEELSHCVLNTYVYAEWTTLKGLYEGRARCIIPHTRDYKDPDGLLSDGDALTEEFNKIIIKIINNERKKANGKLVVIGLENPPYSLANPGNRKGGIKGTFVSNRMANLKLLSTAKQDMATAFIWSGFEFYKPDFYIIYAPIKYWKHSHLIDKKFIKGYLCNKSKFHATESSISLTLWKNKNISNNSLLFDSDLGKRTIKKSKTSIVKIAKKIRKCSNKQTSMDIWLSTCPNINYLGNGFYQEEKNHGRNQIPLSEKNLLISLPIFVANCYKPKDYTEKEVIMKSGDGGTKYQKDKDFLNDCFVWACLTNSNKCISNQQIRNELCLMQDTEVDKLLDINSRNTGLLQKWWEILKLVKTTNEYNPKFTYGLHQICKDINIKIETGDFNKRNEPIMEYKYSDLNDTIKEFKEQLKEFYNKYITPQLFKYELLK